MSISFNCAPISTAHSSLSNPCRWCAGAARVCVCGDSFVVPRKFGPAALQRVSSTLTVVLLILLLLITRFRP